MSDADIDPRSNPRWEQQWSKGLQKGDAFDTGGHSPALQKVLDEHTLPQGRALVPGCGRGYDVLAFAKAGYTAVGLDLSKTGIAAARAHQQEAAPELSERITLAEENFFTFDVDKYGGKFDVILDYTFLCALEPKPGVRENWASRMAELLQPGGQIVTLIFPISDTEGGPPFSVSKQLIVDLLTPLGFEAAELWYLPPELCHKGREGLTALGRWRRK